MKTKYVYDCVEKTEFDECKSYEDFKLLRNQVGVPDDIELKDVFDVYEELKSNK